MYRMFNHTNCTDVNTTAGCPPPDYEWPLWIQLTGMFSVLAAFCVAICLYECYVRVLRRREQAWFRTVGLLEPLNPPDIDLPSMAEETGSTSSMVSSVAPSAV